MTVLLFFRLTLSEGPLASIILTNNIIAVSTIDYLDDDNVFISGMRIFVSLMNLNLGFPLCFYDGMTTPIKTGLQFIFPVYLWTIVIVFIVLVYNCVYSFKPVLHSCLKSDSSIFSASVDHTHPSFFFKTTHH